MPDSDTRREPAWAIGLMTGTVLDGNIDIAMLKSDGETIAEFGAYKLAPYSPGLREQLAEALEVAARWGFDGPEPALFAAAERALTLAQAEAVNAFLAENDISPETVAAIGFHGQTVLHRAPSPGRRGATRQLGDGAMMAQVTGIDTVFDFRSADIAAGGQGAPLAPVYHAALLSRAGAEPGSALLNLGGVANVTWWCGDGRLAAFDTGPANAPINDWVARHGAGPFDRDGRLALAGWVDEDRLARALEHPYLTAAYPKSLDRNSFTSALAEGLSLEDGAATLTAFSAAAVGRGLDILPTRPKRIVLCGGGRRNPALVAEIAKRARVEPVMSEDVGWRGDAVEAECFAFLAIRSLRGLPLSFPETTGVSAPLTGGRIARAPRPSATAATVTA
ncbi:anhydro-N-acetylmuramic acid kinase [Stappia sp. F7233]|uniref:Anhydro-N-acetylmuramic acid kinase n=1 Tax=Stappia albiluteola TaxID=2758565 RepID=A0A839A9S7_9HYPH|nr:anhydro-N-acetylmuramic acid kinase [Stappia albiluteola]MBA5775794.1 anhydro-N-acetylmuramic acid kinase [Stappia albiluteola]